jgi:hypothetical protein
MDRPIRRAKKMPWSDRFKAVDWSVGLGHNGIARLMGRSSIVSHTTCNYVLHRILTGIMSCRTTRLKFPPPIISGLLCPTLASVTDLVGLLVFDPLPFLFISRAEASDNYLLYSGLLYWWDGAELGLRLVRIIWENRLCPEKLSCKRYLKVF